MIAVVYSRHDCPRCTKAQQILRDLLPAGTAVDVRYVDTDVDALADFASIDGNPDDMPRVECIDGDRHVVWTGKDIDTGLTPKVREWLTAS